MDLQQIRALELENEQLERWNNSDKTDTFWDEFEIGQAEQIARYRRTSLTYHLYYIQPTR
jgi:hypothetical protein